MQVVITARHMTLTDQMKEHIERKASKLTKYYDRIQQIDDSAMRGTLTPKQALERLAQDVAHERASRKELGYDE